MSVDEVPDLPQSPPPIDKEDRGTSPIVIPEEPKPKSPEPVIDKPKSPAVEPEKEPEPETPYVFSKEIRYFSRHAFHHRPR